MPRRDVFNDDRTPVGLVLRDARVQEILHLVLEVSVQRQLDVATVLGFNRRLLAAGHDGAVRSDLKGLRARGTRQKGIKLRLHARGPLPFGVHRADDRGRHVAVGVFAFEDGLPLDPVDVELTDLTVGHRIDVSLDVLVGRVAQHHAAQLGLVHAEERGELTSGLSGASPDLVTIVIAMHIGANIHLVDGDVVGLDRVRQHHAGCIGDRSARGRDFGRRRTHTLPLSSQGGSFNDLQLHEPHGADAQGKDEKSQDPP